MDEVAIRVENVSKDFLLPHEKVSSVKGLFTGITQNSNRTKEKQHALKNISFEIKKGEFFGIVGRNGSGKSTLLKILAGIYQPTSGKVYAQGKLVPFIELGVGFNPELSGRENVYLNGAMLGFSEKEIDTMYNDIVSFAELERFMDQKLKNYSSGMQVRLAFSMAIRSEADILLIDEVLAVGDADFQRKCYEYFNYLKRTNVTVVFVSHDMEAVRQYCHRAVLIEDSLLIEEGDANKVSQAYLKQFLNQEQKALQFGAEQEKRWGEGRVKIESIKVEVSDKYVVLHEVIQAYEDVDGCVIGFMVKSTDNSPITGTNSLLEKEEIGSIKNGERLKITWKMPNIFSEGRYFVDPTIHNANTTAVYDWWEEAVSFNVRKVRRLPFYSVDPSFNLHISHD